MYRLAERAFDPAQPYPDLFEQIYAELRSYWQVFRGGKGWTPDQVFDTLVSPACQLCSRTNLDLVKIQKGSEIERVWRCLSAMKGIKILRSGKISAMAVSKFLHFFNPGLFPIYDRKVIGQRAMPSFNEEMKQSRGKWQGKLTDVQNDSAFAHGLGEYLAYTLFASDCFSDVNASASMAIFAQAFDKMVKEEDRGAEAPRGIHRYFATAFEFALIGSSSLERFSMDYEPLRRTVRHVIFVHTLAHATGAGVD